MWKGSSVLGQMLVLKGRDAFSAENAARSQQALFRAIENGSPVLVEGGFVIHVRHVFSRLSVRATIPVS